MSAQLDIPFVPLTRIPPKGSQCYKLLMAMQRGERLTVATALFTYKVYALSQRCGELREDYFWPIRSRFVGRHKEYWLP